MELFLNILWVLIALGLLGAWRTRWIHQRRRTLRHCVQEWSAISVALVLLFFAVSMSDDLHSEIVALEDCSATRRASVHSANAHALPQSGVAPHSTVFAIVPGITFFGQPDLLRTLQPVAQPGASLKVDGRSFGRAPPVLV
jgi:hypothetical protein